MNATTWHFVDASGQPTGATYTGRELEANTPEGCRAVPGPLPVQRREDPEMQRLRKLAQIAELERRQSRPLRELAIDPANAAAAQRLAEIEQTITQLRAEMTWQPV